MDYISREREKRKALRALDNEITPLLRVTHSPAEVATILNLSPQYIQQFLDDENIHYINYQGWINL